MDNATLAYLNSPLRGNCPAPFYDVKEFGLDGCMFKPSSVEYLLTVTVVGGRFCAQVDHIRKGLVCCLPCPLTDYLYPPGECSKILCVSDHH